jgi:hypothetical protein
MTGGPTPTGELGNGQFAYKCVAGSVDVGCSGAQASSSASGSSSTSSSGYVDPVTGATTNLPKALAVGATFSIEYAPLGGSNVIQGDSGFSVSPASPSLADPSGAGLIAKRPGYLALLAYSPDAVEDFVFVRLAAIAFLAPNKAEVFLATAASDTLSVTAEDSTMVALAGQLGCAWTVPQGADKLLLTGPTNGAAVKIEAVADGDATVSVACSGVTTQVLVHVGGGVGIGDGGIDAAGDAGSGAIAEGGSHG